MRQTKIFDCSQSADESHPQRTKRVVCPAAGMQTQLAAVESASMAASSRSSGGTFKLFNQRAELQRMH
eukprot:11176581-Prorocentrum_lima.AAC.1